VVLVREGFAADLVIFDENTISDRATFANPHQYPIGIANVIVNGEIVLENGQQTNARPGIAAARADCRVSILGWLRSLMCGPAIVLAMGKAGVC